MDTVPGWIAPTIAISLLLIAAAFIGILVALVVVGRRASEQAGQLAREVSELHRDLGPTIQAVNRLAAEGSELGGKVREELDELIRLSRNLRSTVHRGARRLERRLEDADALYEIVSGEVEDAALDAAAKLRTLRTGAGALASIRRFLVRKRR